LQDTNQNENINFDSKLNDSVNNIGGIKNLLTGNFHEDVAYVGLKKSNTLSGQQNMDSPP